MFGAYCRLNVHVSESNVAVVRAARGRFAKRFAKSRKPEDRASRKVFYRAMLKEHENARKLFYGNRF